MMRQTKRFSRRVIAASLVSVIVLAALLALDLANHGLAWQTFWSLTGEEEPVGQVRGMVEWLGNTTRVQPNTAPDVPMQHTGINPYGINTFLEQEVEPAKREQQVQMIAAAGFHWLRQQFPWEDIEIHERGDFADRRNVDAVGVLDAWAKYDNIVELTEQYGLEIQARIDTPPRWTRVDQEVPGLAPPDNWDDYINFLTIFAERYQGRIRYYQIWNEPNIFPEWGNSAIDPEAYTDVLCRAYAALKAIDPQNVVISAALSPTVALTQRDLNDFIFLQRMYDAGAKDCFDIMATQGYGFFSGPTDQRLRPTTINFARPQYLRDLMVANGDAAKPIWISEAAWNPVDAPEVPPDMPGRENFGSVTREQAARYMPLAYERAQREMPWIGVINYWFFKRASDSEKNQPFYYFRMVEPDFTPLPIYTAMQQHIASTTPTLYSGVHQADHWAIQAADGVLVNAVQGAQFTDAVQGTTLRFVFHGTDVVVHWLGALDDTISIKIDGRDSGVVTAPTPLIADQADWLETSIFSSFSAETHTVELSADRMVLFDSVSVYDRTREHLTPIIGGGVALGLLALLGIGWALWKRFC